METKHALTKAWSTLTVKSVDEETGIIRGIASTPSTDLAGDIVEPKGAEFKLPIPLLDQHDHSSPIGHVYAAEVRDDGILIEAKIAIDSGLIYVDKVWKQIKAGLVRGLSVGFRALEAEPIKGGKGYRFKKWKWLELSAVTIPANMDASISVVKSIDLAESDPTVSESADPSDEAPVSDEYVAAKKRSAAAVIAAKRAIRKRHIH